MLRRVAVPLVLLSLAGCGTFLNVHRVEDLTGGQRQIYGGVTGSCRGVREGIREATASPKLGLPLSDAMYSVFMTGLAAACLVDVPLSLVGDTLTLPITVPAGIDRVIEGYYGPGGDGYVRPPEPLPLPDANTDTEG